MLLPWSQGVHISEVIHCRWVHDVRIESQLLKRDTDHPTLSYHWNIKKRVGRKFNYMFENDILRNYSKKIGGVLKRGDI